MVALLIIIKPKTHNIIVVKNNTKSNLLSLLSFLNMLNSFVIYVIISYFNIMKSKILFMTIIVYRDISGVKKFLT